MKGHQDAMVLAGHVFGLDGWPSAFSTSQVELIVANLISEYWELWIS